MLTFFNGLLARALACKVNHHHWNEKLSLEDLKNLARMPHVNVRVTEHPANCSLFFTKTSVLYDPYLWALPCDGGRVENNFWVFQFSRVKELEHDCYKLLEKHFKFHFDQGIPLVEFIGHDEQEYRRQEKIFHDRVNKKH